MPSEPTRYRLDDGKIEVRLDHEVGDLSILAMRSALPDSRAIAVFEYEDRSVNIIGCQDVANSIRILENTLMVLKAIRAGRPQSVEQG